MDYELDLPGHVWVEVSEELLDRLLGGTKASRKAKRDKENGVVAPPRKRFKL
jgi:hypothetical protein